MADNDFLNLQDGLAPFQWEYGSETYANYEFGGHWVDANSLPTPATTDLVDNSTLVYASNINADPDLGDVADNNVGTVGVFSTNRVPDRTIDVPNLPSE